MTPAELAQLRADLAAARLRRVALDRRWAEATYATGADDPEALDVELAQVDATIAALEERMAGAATAEAPSPAPVPASPALAPAAPAEYVDTATAARILGVTPKTLEALRARGSGPPFTKVGRRVRYALADLRTLARGR